MFESRCFFCGERVRVDYQPIYPDPSHEKCDLPSCQNCAREYLVGIPESEITQLPTVEK